VQYLVTGGLDDTVRVWKWVDSDDGSGGGQVGHFKIKYDGQIFYLPVL
jgi:hypothetical protein